MLRRIFLALGLAVTGAVAEGAAVPSLYWSEAGGMARSRLDGSAIEPVVNGFEIGGLDFDRAANQLVYTDVLPLGCPCPGGVIYGADLDGAAAAPLVNQLNEPAALAVDRVGGQIFWADRAAHTISFTGYAGGGAKEFLAHQDSIADIAGLAIDPWEKKLYFSFVNPLIDSLAPGGIARMNLDGSELETVVSGLVAPQGVSVDFVRGRVYWADQLFQRSGVISSANLDGGDRQKVAAGLVSPRGLALDPFANQLYWADEGAGKIQTHTPFVEAADVVTDRNSPVSIGILYHSGVAGDTNDDGLVDLADLNNVRNHFGELSGIGDSDLDGDVDLDDLNEVRNHFGERFQPPDEVAGVPEPATAWLLVLAFAACGPGLTRKKKAAQGPAKNLERR